LGWKVLQFWQGATRIVAHGFAGPLCSGPAQALGVHQHDNASARRDARATRQRWLRLRCKLWPGTLLGDVRLFVPSPREGH